MVVALSLLYLYAVAILALALGDKRIWSITRRFGERVLLVVRRLGGRASPAALVGHPATPARLAASEWVDVLREVVVAVEGAPSLELEALLAAPAEADVSALDAQVEVLLRDTRRAAERDRDRVLAEADAAAARATLTHAALEAARGAALEAAVDAPPGDEAAAALLALEEAKGVLYKNSYRVGDKEGRRRHAAVVEAYSAADERSDDGVQARPFRAVLCQVQPGPQLGCGAPRHGGRGAGVAPAADAQLAAALPRLAARTRALGGGALRGGRARGGRQSSGRAGRGRVGRLRRGARVSGEARAPTEIAMASDLAALARTRTRTTG